jgi:hypothetical protein
LAERALVLLASLPFRNLSAFSLPVSAWLPFDGEMNMWELSSKVAWELSKSIETLVFIAHY